MTVFFWLGAVVALALVGVLGDFFIKLAGAQTPANLKIFLLGLVVYASTAFGWFFAMRHLKLSTLGVFYALGTVLFLTAVSVWYFQEPLTGYEILGIALALLSLILLGRFA